MIEVREIVPHEKKYNPDNPIRPTVISWNCTYDAKMIRSHSIIATVREIIQASQSQDVVQINIIGDPSSGKTVLAKTIQHLIHKYSKIPFSVRSFAKEDLLDFEQTLRTLQPANYVLLFDDLSFLGAIANKRQIEMVKQAITEIRHLEGGQDVKIIIIKVFHYTLGLDKYLRQNDFSYFTSVGSSEDENMEKIVGGKNMPKVRAFKKMRTKIKIAPENHKKFSYALKIGKPPFTYIYRKPFQPELFWNGDTLRNIVSPTREWIDPICSICSHYGSKKKFESDIDIKQFIEEGGKSYSPSAFKLAVENILQQNGVNVRRPNVVSAERFIKMALDKKQINLDDIANYYEFTPTKTKMRKPLDLILEKVKKDNPLPESQKITSSNDGLESSIQEPDLEQNLES